MIALGKYYKAPLVPISGLHQSAWAQLQLIAGNAEHYYCHHRGPTKDTANAPVRHPKRYKPQCPVQCYWPTWRHNDLRISRATMYPLYHLQPQHHLLVHQVAQNIREVENCHACTPYHPITFLSDVNTSLKSSNRALQQNYSTYLLSSHPDSNVISSVPYQPSWPSISWPLLMTHGPLRA